ncbi:MAG: TerC family protein [Caldilineaceae bacterium]|nr:TerC family protein [Caldilineaceae bacterium]MBP8106407.1 TerC family protein [Caldilineaceae bacterium]MBP8121410.1 TerC family protein [Caldilineaceae bacterium]MBP9072712.1 TerC family protein [Caldilineaceae bacterium]
MATSIWFWIIFNVAILGLLALDLGVFHRKAHAVSVKEAAIWSVVWISLSLLFNLGIFLFEGKEIAMQFLAGYLIEKSLSVDNIFVFIMLFSFFQVPAAYQHRVLFWGILGALIMRGALIGAGAFLIAQFSWVLYIFGAFLVYTGIRMALQKDDIHVDVDSNQAVKLLRRIFPITDGYRGQKFMTVENGVRMATPLLVVLLIVETTDLIFALDSIPAIFAVTQDPFIVYTSNVCAILGLRALYFLLAGVMQSFHYLKYGLSLVLVFVGVKMLIADFYHVSIGLSLSVIGVVLTVSILASLLFPRPGVATISSVE